MKKYPIQSERLYLRSPNINVCFRAIIDTPLEKEKIEEAVKKVCIRHPLLGYSIEIDNDNNAWFVKKDRLINIEYYKSDEMDWQAWYKRADSIPFDFLNGSLLRICVIKDENTEIIFLGHHIIGDGIGYLNLVKDFLLALDNRIDIKPQLPPFEAADKYFKETVLLDSGVESFAKNLNEEWKKSRRQFSETDYRTFFTQYRNKYISNLYMASIEGENLQKIMEKSKLNGFTINDIIASAFSVAAMEALNCSEIRLGVAANIRNELVSEPNECMGNFVTGISVKAQLNRSNDFISNANEIRSLLQDKLKNAKNKHLAVHFMNVFDRDLIESTMYAAYGDFDHHVSKKLAELMGEQTENKGLGISNLGRYNICEYRNFNILDIQFIGPAFPANLLTVDIITVNNKLNLCLRYNEVEINTNTIKIICERAIGCLN
ncbi:MAG: condensation domain-containing protein [Bacteroidales bacterium]|jgi:NRPS condensation-like uncharacterized protein|nr:condensation domain-containing protein [Bacteroidales bacterium]